ncbi:MAG TPA: hypothetical protein VD772_00890 [Anseongella sp.]|nr:hypothetical protein [Anseongella sp.]
MNQSLTAIYNKVTSGIFNKKKATASSTKVLAGDMADILYGILNYADSLPAEKFKGQWEAGEKLPGQYWLTADKIWRRLTAGTDAAAPTVANTDWELIFAAQVPPIRYTIPFGPQTSVQVPFVKQTTVTLLRKFGEVATLQYRIGTGTLTTVAFTGNSAAPNLVIPAGSYLDLTIGWGALPSGKGSIYLEATEI